MVIGLFASLRLSLYGACRIGGVKLEEIVWSILNDLEVLLLLTFVPEISTALLQALDC